MTDELSPLKITERADMAILIVGDDPMMACAGCSAILEATGLLTVERAYRTGAKGSVYVKIYSVSPGHSIQECREAVRERHVNSPGNPLNH